MSVLPKSFQDVVKFAGIEVLLRGVGPYDEFNYSIRDCLQVALHMDVNPTVSIEAFAEEYSQTTACLLSSYRAFLGRTSNSKS